ncbi:MAG: 50S ribosomal protein L4 [Nanoarchaeota archaeon]|nr:50S ribosomal protein L4 [Nanoarchaeota archaeon]
MKVKLYDLKGDVKSDIELPQFFSAPLREDLAMKYFEVEKYELRQPYSTNPEAGKRHSASGRIRHIRHKWRTAYGKGISRVPRKTMWRRGTQFLWIGAEVSNARGGRRAHPPQGIYSARKINKKEIKLAFSAAFAATADKETILKRYSSLNTFSIPTPVVVESLPSKTKEILSLCKKIFGEAYSLVEKKQTVRSGKGKSRGRMHKSNAGLLVVTSKDEKIKCSNVEVKSVKEVKMADLYPLGRLTLYTKKSLEELKNVA